MAVMFFWLFLVFLAMSLLLVVAPGMHENLPALESVDRAFVSYPALALNISTASYLIYFVAALDEKPVRVYLVGFWLGASIMLGSGASLALDLTIAEADILRLAFGESQATAFNFFFATVFTGWMARQFQKQSLNLSSSD